MPKYSGWDESAQAWADFVSKGDPNRNWLLDPVMIRECGEVRGREVIDVGCGEGRFARMLAERGAIVTALDPTAELVGMARAQGPDIRYHVAPAENIPEPDAQFDVVVSYLVLIDIPDFRAGIREMARVLKSGGILVIANLNSFMTTRPYAWEHDEVGGKLYVPLDYYMEERGNVTAWKGIEVINWHRPFSAYVQALLDVGLVLEHLEEVVPSAEAVAANPNLADQYRAPYFHVMRWRKP